MGYMSVQSHRAVRHRWIAVGLAVAGLAGFAATPAQAGHGIFESYVIINPNGGGNTYYDLSAVTANPDFQGANLGTFNTSLGNTLVLNGGEVKTFKNGGDDVTSARTQYRITLVGNTPGGFTPVNDPFGADLGGGDQKWTATAANINLLTGLAAGTYNMAVYSESSVNFNGGGSGTDYANNGGANYTAQFTVLVPEPTTFALLGIAGAALLTARRRLA